MEKLVITCALAGAITKKSQTPYVPSSPEEMADEAYRAFNAGAHMVHLHALDAKGKDRGRVDVLNETVQRIRFFSIFGTCGYHIISNKACWRTSKLFDK